MARDSIPFKSRFSAGALVRHGLTSQRSWPQMWTSPTPRKTYQVIIIGGGGHGLATAYYLARDWGIRDVAVIEKNWIGGGNTGRNTTIVPRTIIIRETHGSTSDRSICTPGCRMSSITTSCSASAAS